MCLATRLYSSTDTSNDNMVVLERVYCNDMYIDETLEDLVEYELEDDGDIEIVEENVVG